MLGSHSTGERACSPGPISPSLSAARGPDGGWAAAGAAAWAGVGHEVSVGDGLCSPGPGCPPGAGQQWPSLQDFRLWAGTSGPGRGCLHHHGEESFPPGKPAPLFPVRLPWSPRHPTSGPFPAVARLLPPPCPSTQLVLNKCQCGHHLVVSLCPFSHCAPGRVVGGAPSGTLWGEEHGGRPSLPLTCLPTHRVAAARHCGLPRRRFSLATSAPPAMCGASVLSCGR